MALLSESQLDVGNGCHIGLKYIRKYRVSYRFRCCFFFLNISQLVLRSELKSVMFAGNFGKIIILWLLKFTTSSLREALGLHAPIFTLN